MALSGKKRLFEGKYIRLYSGKTSKGSSIVQLVLKSGLTNGDVSWADIRYSKKKALAAELLKAAVELGAKEPKIPQAPLIGTEEAFPAMSKLAKMDVVNMLARLKG